MIKIDFLHIWADHPFKYEKLYFCLQKYSKAVLKIGFWVYRQDNIHVCRIVIAELPLDYCVFRISRPQLQQDANYVSSSLNLPWLITNKQICF